MTMTPQRQRTDGRRSPLWKLAPLALTLVAVAMSGCSADSRYQIGPTAPGPVVVPSPGSTPVPGAVVTQARQIHGVDGVSLTGVGQVFVEHGPVESLTVTAPEGFLPHLSSEVIGGVLVLGKDPQIEFSTPRDIIFRLTVTRLDEASLHGVGEIDITGIDADRFAAELRGVGTIAARGRADRQQITMSGLGDYLAADLVSRIASVNLQGSTRAVVRVDERLEGTAFRPATLEYYGDPVVAVAGGGTVRRIGP